MNKCQFFRTVLSAPVLPPAINFQTAASESSHESKWDPDDFQEAEEKGFGKRGKKDGKKEGSGPNERTLPWNRQQLPSFRHLIKFGSWRERRILVVEAEQTQNMYVVPAR